MARRAGDIGVGTHRCRAVAARAAVRHRFGHSCVQVLIDADLAALETANSVLDSDLVSDSAVPATARSFPAPIRETLAQKEKPVSLQSPWIQEHLATGSIRRHFLRSVSL